MWKWNRVIGVLVGLGSVCCTVTVRPQNTVALKGERASLECRTTDGSVVREWSFIPSSNPKEQRQVIFSNWNSQPRLRSPRFGVDIDDSGSGTLYRVYTNDTQFDDGGTFICSVEGDRGITRFSAKLIVLGSMPVCSVRKYDAGNIKAECGVGFSGNWAPKMAWRHHSKREAHEAGTLFISGVTNYNNKTHVTSTLNIVLYSAKDSLSVSCKMSFDPRNSTFPSGSATNIPSFVHIWTSPVFGSKDFVPDPDAALTTSSLGVVSDTLSGQSTDAIQSEASRGMDSGSQNPLPVDGDGVKNESRHWTLMLAGGGVLAIILIFLMIGAIVCIVRKKKTKEKPEGNVNVTFRKETTTANDSNVYESILLYDDNGYRIPLQDSIDGNSPVESLPAGSLDPYYVSTLTRQSTSNEVKCATAKRLVSKESSKSPEVKGVEAENEKVAYLQLISDSADVKVHEKDSPSSRQSGETSPANYTSYTPLVRAS